MSRDTNFYDSAYGNFANDVLSEIRIETYGKDLGQNSWITADEYDHFCELLKIDKQSRVLETASGSGAVPTAINQEAMDFLELYYNPTSCFPDYVIKP